MADDILEAARFSIVKTAKISTRKGRTLHALLTCQWCMSIWVAALVMPVAWFWGQSPWALVPALVLAASQLTGMLAGLGRKG